MRNIRVADRADWVVDATPKRQPNPRTRVRDWLATATMFLLIPALILPFAGASAGGATLAVSPDAAAPGERILVRGNNLPKGDAVLVWNGEAGFEKLGPNIYHHCLHCRLRAAIP